MEKRNEILFISIDITPFSRVTIFNFQNRLAEYKQEPGVNLLEKAFDSLTAGQLKKLKIKTDIQIRMYLELLKNKRNKSAITLL